MNRFENLLIESEDNDITVVEKAFKSNAKGLCKGKKDWIKL